MEIGMGILRVGSHYGPELLANPVFASGLTGWSVLGAGVTPTVVAGVCTLTEDGVDGISARIYQSFATVVGASYTVSVQINAPINRGQLAINTTSSISGAIYASGPQGNGALKTITTSFVATASTTFMIIDVVNTPATTMTIQNCSVRRRT